MNSPLNMSKKDTFYCVLWNSKFRTQKQFPLFLLFNLQVADALYFRVKYEVFPVNEQGFKGPLFVLVFRLDDQFRSGYACKITQFVFLSLEGRRFCHDDDRIINLCLPKQLPVGQGVCTNFSPFEDKKRDKSQAKYILWK